MSEKQKQQIIPLRNPSQMDTYVHVTSPRTWLIAVALFLVMAALTFWGFFGRIPQYYETIGVGTDYLIDYDADGEASETDDGMDDPLHISSVFCLVEPNLFNSKQLNDKQANVYFLDGTFIQGTTYLEKGSPSSQSEIESVLASRLIDDDWVISNLRIEKNKYWYLVEIRLEDDLDDIYWGATCDVSIVTHEDAPITYLFQRQ